jgi:hypothetical protein
MLATKEKSFSKKIPKIVPLNSERKTFLLYSESPIAKIDGKRDKAESSIQ